LSSLNLRSSLPGSGRCFAKIGSSIPNHRSVVLSMCCITSAVTHRVAISNHRLVSFEDGQVTFRWRDSAHNNEQKLMALSLDEFLRRFLLHLPKGFVRIRHFGFVASRRRAQLLPLCLAALDSLPAQTETSTTQDMSPHRICPQCGSTMAIIERLTAAQIQLRSPPKLSIAAA